MPTVFSRLKSAFGPGKTCVNSYYFYSNWIGRSRLFPARALTLCGRRRACHTSAKFGRICCLLAHQTIVVDGGHIMY